MGAMLYVVLGWFIREVVLKFVILAAIFAVLVIVVPMAANQLAPFIGTTSLSGLFNAVPDSVYFFFYFFKLDVGLPLVISALVGRFLIRRLPVIG